MFIRVLVCLALLSFLFFAALALAQEAGEAAAAPLGMKLLMRWMHILAAITLLGGSIFMWAVILPVTGKALEPEQAQALRAAIVGRWRKFVPWLIIAFIVSGLYNYLKVTRHLHPLDSPYHMFFAIKFLLAMVVFALAMTITSPEAWAAKIRAKADKWLLLLLGLGVAIVLLAGYMKVMA